MVGCVTKRETINTISPSLKYTFKDETQVNTMGTRLWILFIPIGFGAKSYEARKEKAIQRFLKHNSCDAILNGKIVDRKIIIPLIAVTYSYRWCNLVGKPCVIKSDTLK